VFTGSPRYLRDLLTLAADVPRRPSVRSSSRGDFIVPRTSRKFRDRAFSVAVPGAWNRLPVELRFHATVQAQTEHIFISGWASELNYKLNWLCNVPPSTVGVGGALEILFVLYCICIKERLTKLEQGIIYTPSGVLHGYTPCWRSHTHTQTVPPLGSVCTVLVVYSYTAYDFMH